MYDKRAVVVDEMKKLMSQTKPILEIFSSEEVISKIQDTRDGRILFDYMATNHGVCI